MAHVRSIICDERELSTQIPRTRGCYPMINQHISNPNPSHDISIANGTKNVWFRTMIKHTSTIYKQPIKHHNKLTTHAQSNIPEIKEQT